MPKTSLRYLWTVAVVATLFAVAPCSAEDLELPEIKFFYFSELDSEWAVSAEGDALQTHLATNSDSSALFNSMLDAIGGDADPERVRQRIGRWIEDQRRQFDQTGNNKVLYRKSEGILAYLRAHDFEVPKLVKALKRRSGASSVALIGMHLVDKSQNSAFKVKVVLQDPTVDLGRQGINVDLRSSQVSDISVVFALGVALYEVHELLNSDAESEDINALDDVEQIEPVPTPALPPAGGVPQPATG